MAAPYTRRFTAHYQGTPGYATIWTVPAGSVWILRDIVLANQGGAAEVGQLWIQAPNGDAFVLYSATIQPGSSGHSDLRQQLLPGEPLRCGFATSSWSVILTGYEFLS